MSSDTYRSIRGYLCSTSAITSYVPKGSIRIGWPRELKTFPCILISQAGGSDVGFMGYANAGTGSRYSQEQSIVQIDIFSRTDRRNTYKIADEIVPVMISGSACRKNSDIDLYDDELGVYRKSLTFSCWTFHDD